MSPVAEAANYHEKTPREWIETINLQPSRSSTQAAGSTGVMLQI